MGFFEIVLPYSRAITSAMVCLSDNAHACRSACVMP